MAQASDPRSATVTSINQIIEEIEGAEESLDEYDSIEAVFESDDSLAELWSAIKSLEDAAEEARKEVVEAEMEERVDPGEEISGVSLIQSHRKYVEEDAGTVIGRAVNRGIDYTEFTSVNASTLASDYPELATIGLNEYTYFR